MFAIALFFTTLPFLFFGGSTSRIAIGEETVLVEVADTPESRVKGLMGRTHLAPNTGMLFVFEEPQPLAFWMKDTVIPLSIAFFDDKKQLIETLDMPVLRESDGPPRLFKSSRPALYALEVPQHWFAAKRIERGMEFSFLEPQESIE
jgi:uncharacterized protein